MRQADQTRPARFLKIAKLQAKLQVLAVDGRQRRRLLLLLLLLLHILDSFLLIYYSSLILIPCYVMKRNEIFYHVLDLLLLDIIQHADVDIIL